MAIQLADGFSLKAKKPLDARLQYSTVATMAAVPDSELYDGCKAYVTAEKKFYVYDSTNDADPTLGKWREFEAGGADNVIDGYRKEADGLFYEENTYTTLIPGAGNTLYVDIPNDTVYRYNGTDFVLVSGAIDTVVYQPGGSYTFANLPALSANTLGFVYDVSDDFTTTADFLEGAGHEYPAGTNVVVVNAGTAASPVYKYDVLTGNLAGYQKKMQMVLMPTASADLEGVIYQYVGATTATLTNGYFYKCVSDGEPTPTYSWAAVNVQSGGGDASLETDITANVDVGGITNGTLIANGSTFTEVMQKLLVKETAPTTTFTASGSGVKEVGTSVTPTLTLVINSKGTGTPTAIKFYSGSTLLDTQAYVSGTSSYSFTMATAITDTTTVKGVLEYKKSDGTTTATVEKAATYTFVMASYSGAVTSAPTDKAGITALTKNVKNSKGFTTTFNLNNQRSCYCYPASMGNLTSIKDANNFEYISSYTKTNVTVDGVSYNVYTLTDPVTASGFKQIFA